MKSVTLCAALLACAATASPAAVLYKSVGPNGTVEFSDLLPEKGRRAEQIRIPDSSSPGSTGAPIVAASGPTNEERLREADAAVARASAQLDMAEHALAEARRSVDGDYDPMRMVSSRPNRTDQDRLAFYKKDVLIARAQLLDLLKEKRKATPPQTMTASNEWVPVNPGGRQ